MREDQLARAAPALDPEMRRHLVMDSDRAWRSYGRRAGSEVLAVAVRELLPGLRSKDFREFERNRDCVEAALLRVAIAWRDIHHMDALERRIRANMALTPKVDFERFQWERRSYELATDTVLTLEARVQELDRVVHRFLAYGDSGRALFAAVPAIHFERDRGRDDLYAARLRAAIPLARSTGEFYVACQLLGELGLLHWNAGKSDSLQACYDEAIDLAQRHEFLDQASRLLRFYAVYYAQRGQLAVASEKFSEARRLADRPGSDTAPLRFQVEYALFLASFECWDLVERSLRSLPPLLRRVSAPGHTDSRLRYTFESEMLRAQLASATGRVDEGVRRLERLSESVPPFARRVGLRDLLNHWSRELEKAGRYREALEISNRGATHCDTAHVPHLDAFLLRAARLEALQGRLDRAQALLDSAQPHLPPPEEWSHGRLLADVLQARLLFLAGRRPLAKQRIEDAYRRFRSHWRRGSVGNLEPLGAGDLRNALHEIEQFTPEQGYQFELNWRSLARQSHLRKAPSIHTEPRGSRHSIREVHHLVYRFTADRLVRWVANSAGVVVDTLPLGPDQCLVEVRRALELLHSEPAVAGGFLGPESFACLRRLSELLLPPGLDVSLEKPRPLHISPDGPLYGLPFEALPFPSASGAPPLAVTADIAYVRGFAGAAPADNGNVVIVSNPSVPDVAALRYGWTSSLRASGLEAREAIDRWPRAVVLSGSAATKDSIRSRWPGASIIYVAAHHVRDPGAPIPGFVPLPAPPGAPADASVLESADIRALDLSACRLAVLASCSSGTPYRSAVNPGPGLGDAFLDSGAASVVRSFWDVGDLETRDFMRLFLSHWRADQPDAVSLGNARREFMKTPGGSSPRVWAVWSVLTRSDDSRSATVSAR